MTLTYTLKNPYPDSTVKELLEEHLLIPRKIRHFLRTKKHLLINGENINWQSLVKTGDTIQLTFDDDDYPQKTIPFGDSKLVDCLYQDEQRKPSTEFINITLEPDITTYTSAVVLNIVFLYIEHNRTDGIIKEFINIHSNTIYRIISSKIYIQE